VRIAAGWVCDIHFLFWQVIKAHPHLGDAARQACADSGGDDVYRLKLCLYYDEVEVVNALSFAAGKHKLGLFYFALIDLPQNMRMALHNIQLATVVLDKDFGTYGPKQIICGPEGEAALKGSSIGAAMERLHHGRDIWVPMGPSRTMVKTCFKGWAVCLSADYPAAAKCLGFKASVSAHCFCRACNIDKSDSSVWPKAVSFLVQLRSLFTLRTAEAYAADKATFEGLTSDTEREQHCQRKGITYDDTTGTGGGAYDNPMWRLPEFDITTMCPADMMHVAAEGVLKLEIAALVYVMTRTWRIPLSEINAAIRAYSWPSGMGPPPYFTAALISGRVGGMAKKGAHIHGTAAQVLHFTQHSIQVLGPLIAKAKKVESDPWVCWSKHVQIIALMMQHSIHVSQVLLLDHLIYEHQSLFLTIKEYAGLFKPKHHMEAHIPLDILRFGPCRHYWCMRFEAMNQVFKRIAVGGSFQSPLLRCATFWSIKTAMNVHGRTSKKIDEWGETWWEGGGVDEVTEDNLHRLAAPLDIIMTQVLATLQVSATTVEWISALHHLGHTYKPGETWVLATSWESTEVPVLANIIGMFVHPENGVVLAFQQYPEAMGRDDLGTPVAHLEEGVTVVRPYFELLEAVSMTPLYKVDMDSRSPGEKAKSMGQVKTIKFVPAFK